MTTIPTFHTPRLVIREVVESDAPSYRKHFTNYEVVRYLGAGVPWPYPEDGVINFLRNDIFPYQGKERWLWAVTLKENTEELIGAIELLRKPSPSNRGFWLAEEHWGKGYMTEAVKPITDYAFNELGFEKLIFANAVGNPRSGRVKEKSGAQFIRREPASYMDPTFTERDIYELTKARWQEVNS